MKNKYLIVIMGVFFALFFTSCHDILTNLDNETEMVTDSLSYKELIGTYTFVPKDYQAKILHIETKDTIILKITSDSLHTTKSGGYSGKYEINRMILVKHINYTLPYKNDWYLDFLKEKNILIPNILNFNQNIKNFSNISYEIRKDTSGVLHIIGVTGDEGGEYNEAFEVFNFKKTK
ncbi:hypothetical protein [Pedobacter paludis]|nr:hypothetical protein [Pedobacter paludis]